MDWLDRLRTILDYVEEHLDDEIDYNTLGALVGYSAYHLQRLFLMLAGLSLAEYIRRRRLSCAAADLLQTDARVLDIAVKYGYSSAGAFNRAFKALHGAAPGEVRSGSAPATACPPLSFDIAVRGAQPLQYRMVEMGAFRVVGNKLHTTMENGASYTALPAFWAETIQRGPGDILALMDTPPLGLLGVSDYQPDLDASGFDYYIAAASTKPVPAGMVEFTVPAATWAAFPHQNEGPAAVQAYQTRIVTEWLPQSGYEFGRAPDVEVYDATGGMETWLPVAKPGQQP